MSEKLGHGFAWRCRLRGVGGSHDAILVSLRGVPSSRVPDYLKISVEQCSTTPALMYEKDDLEQLLHPSSGICPQEQQAEDSLRGFRYKVDASTGYLIWAWY